MKKQGVDIKEEWLRPDTYTFKIPTRILEGLGIQRMETSFNFESSGNNTFNRSPGGNLTRP